ncbi:(5-formylfuran-3-yl)methyl phosphate synthase [Xanthobacter sp. TB0139]|uniref:(5-formylfuran-3-yl)methyl phosphate synthase n=1 Tax=Xanthobacter sp. TB0139 TaxID=3459178 RepID=UPI0040398328
MKLLVSVRSPVEALAAASAGADFIDLKEPAAGALGGLPLSTIRAILAQLRERPGLHAPVSATIGDFPADAVEAILSRVQAVHECGVDHVKVGIERGPHAAGLIDTLARLNLPLIPVLIADDGIDMKLVRAAAARGFPAIMLDTADKQTGPLLDFVTDDDLHAFITTVRHAGAMAGLAGALRLEDLPHLLALAPDFAGFRTAVCAPSPAGRAGPLDPERIRQLHMAALHQPSQALLQTGNVFHVDPA